MKLTKERNKGFGSLPEYGAIFMSNNVTKKECLRRKVFGLSSTHHQFVKHVRAGMILFLFEYERRELYGVFEACSDGAMNIVPDAFSSCGMHCPAQVKVKCVWVCEPLPENEFHDAIKDNYFSPKKFNFGLCEAQVLRLLQLFSLRRLGEPERRLPKSRNSKSTVYTSNKVRQVDDRRSRVNDGVNGVYVWGNSNVDIEPGSVTTTEDHLLGLDEMESNNSKFAMWNGNHVHTDLQPAVSSGHSKYPFGEVRRVPGDEFRLKCYKDSEPTVGSKYPTILQSKHGGSVDSMNPLLATNPLVPDKMKPLSPFHRQMDSQLMANLSSKASYGDAVVMSTRPYDSVAPCLKYQCPSSNEVNFHSTVEGRLSPYGYSDNVISSSEASYGDAVVMSTRPYDAVAPGFNYQCSSSNEVKFQSTVEGRLPSYGFSDNVISSSRKQPFSSYPDPKGMNDFLNKKSTFRDHFSFSGPSPNENSYHGTITSMSQSAYSENLDAESLKNQSYTGMSSLKFSLSDVPSIRSTIDLRENKFSSCYPPSSNNYSSLVGDYGYQVEPEDHLELEAAWTKKGEAFMDDTTPSYEDPIKLQGFVSSVDPQSMQHYEHDYDLEPYQSSDTLYSAPPKNRISVFSRLALAPDAHLSEHNADTHYEISDSSKSVDVIMEMLHKHHNRWAKLKKAKPGNKQDDVEKPGNKRKATASCKAEIDCLKVPAAKDKKVDILPSGADIKEQCTLAGPGAMQVFCFEEKGTQSSEAKPILNFKRRSEMRRFHNDGSATCCSATLMSEGVLRGEQKKKRLVRPIFIKNDPSDDKGIENYSMTLQESAQRFPCIKDNTGGCEGVSGGQQKKRKLVRPNFSKNDSSDDKDVKNCTSISQESAQEIPIIKDKIRGCEASVVNQKSENRISFQSGKDLHLIAQPDDGDKEFNSESRDTRVGSCIRSPTTSVEVGKESANKEIDVQKATNPEMFELENAAGDLTVNGTFPDPHKTSHFFVKETLLPLPEEKVETGNEVAGDELEGKDKVGLLPSPQSVDETCNQFSDFRREGKEQMAIHVGKCKENVQQISLRSSSEKPEESSVKPMLSHEVSHKKRRKLKRWDLHK